MMLLVMCLTTLLLTSVISSTETNSLNGRHLNNVIFHNPPFDTLIQGPNGTFTYSGASLKILIWLATKYNFTYGLVIVNETLVEKYGTHEAAFYMLINNQDIDGIACSFYLSLDRKERMDFSFFTWSETFRLVVPRSGEESRLFAFIRPFQPIVWLVTLVVIVAMIGTMTLFVWIYNSYLVKPTMLKKEIPGTRDEKKMESISRKSLLTFASSQMVYVINIMTNQGSKEILSRNSFRILAGFFLLGAMVLVNSYSGIVISSLTVPNMKPSVDSLEDLASNQEIGVLLRHDTSIGEQILKATTGVFNLIGDKARRFPDQILGDPFKLNAKLQTGRYAYPFVQTFCASFVANQYKKDGYCRFKMSKRLPVSDGYYHWLVKKNNRHMQIVNKGLVHLFESGLVRFWIKDSASISADECFVANRKHQRSARQVPIHLSDLTSAFLILGIGIGLATFRFIIEISFFKCRQHKQQI